MSNPTQEMASPTALWDWCRVTCARYRNVEIKNLTTSFRDGLAFCAIIHEHRPDLIDFSSLSKDNAHQNNSLAFETAETKLGIPALLHPSDLVSTKVPDCLGIITYLSWYYNYFNRKSDAGPASSESRNDNIFNSLTESEISDGPKKHRRWTHLESRRGDWLSKTRPRAVCHLCFKPVHLIQRRLIDGKVYHRSCFRCRVCHSTLLPGFYTQGSDSGSWICAHHTTDSKSAQPDLSYQVGSSDSRLKCTYQALCSLSGLAISSVPHYSKIKESVDGLVFKAADMECKDGEVRSTEGEDGGSKDCTVEGVTVVPPPVVAERTVEEAVPAGPAPVLAEGTVPQEDTQQPAELLSAPARSAEEGSQSVPAPRQQLGSSSRPVPSPRTRTSPNSSIATGNSANSCVCSSGSRRITNPTTGSRRVQSNHPWLTIVYPGPWTRLPPAPAPAPTPNVWSRHRQRVPTPNPFGKVAHEKPADQAKSSVAVVHSGNIGDLGGVTETVGASSDPAAEHSLIGATGLDEKGVSLSKSVQKLPRRFSLPTITPSNSSLPPANTTEANKCDQVTSLQSKVACKENPFDRSPALPESKTCQTLLSTRPSSPMHGFPLTKRKVQADHNIATESLQVEMRELDERLETMERRGVELERHLRDCTNEEEEEQMLIEWFSLNHERHLLVRRDMELSYLTMQQKLEERQTDVAFQLQCLHFKQESGSSLSKDDRGQEQRLMYELVSIIDQRNQIISILDQDMQREREEDKLLKVVMNSKELQKERLKELRKSKGKFSPSKVFQLLNHKAAQTSKGPTNKKS